MILRAIKTITGYGLGAIILLSYSFAGPATLIYLISEDAAYYHSFFGWVGLFLIDSFAASIWPFYWLSRLIFGG
jgi:hypothetical protein